jgi:hypothetical protein
MWARLISRDTPYSLYGDHENKAVAGRTMKTKKFKSFVFEICIVHLRVSCGS